MRLDQIQNPTFLKELSVPELRVLSKDIREAIIETVSKKGGHLSSNLGIVDVTIALHRIFNAPRDKFIFDVGHQSYTHKILTGRYGGFSNSLREFSGISGYQKRSESEYDCYEAGHSSTSISAACGFAVAQRLKGETDQIIAIIGDASITSGMALEALNNLGMMKEKVIVILNDNNMAISKPVGAISRLFSRLRISSPYTSTKNIFRKMLLATGAGRWLITYLRKLKNAMRRFFVGTTLFEKLNLEYIGPIDGHNYREMLRIFKIAKERSNSVVVHVITKKGQGYPWAENDADGKWHGVNGFNVETGQMDGHSSIDEVSWSEATAKIVEAQMEIDPLLTVITPAMIEGSKLNPIFLRYPKRSFDVGIAEQHAVTFASGMSAEGAHPYVCIYSTFLQRSYDQIIHDFGRMKLPVVFGLDRAGWLEKMEQRIKEFMMWDAQDNSRVHYRNA
jgi:1-deoxy-D-xylulose-5-phosphate synthase